MCSLLALVSNAWFPLLIYSPLLFLFFFFLQLKNALLILTWTFLFPSQWVWHLDSLSFLSLYLTSLEEEKVVLAISLYNLLIPSLLPNFPVLFPFPNSLICSLKKKKNHQINSWFLYFKKFKSLHDRITCHESEDELQKLLYDFGESRCSEDHRIEQSWCVPLWEMWLFLVKKTSTKLSVI